MTAASATSGNDPILLRHDEDGIATLTLNRPDKFNALSTELMGLIERQLDSLPGDKSIRAVIIAANGKAFCAGHDLREMSDAPGEEAIQALFDQSSRMMASEEARFATSGINVGLFCGTPMVAVTRNLPRKQAMEMLKTGEFIDAPTAERYGLVNRVVAAGELDAAIRELAATVAAQGPAFVAAGKKLFYRQIEDGLTGAYKEATKTMVENMQREDARQGITAFLEKRDMPEWKDR